MGGSDVGPQVLASVSPIATVPEPSTADLLVLERRVYNIVEQERASIGCPSQKSISNCLRAARLHVPLASSDDVADFILWKLRTRGDRFRNWGGVYRAVLEDYPSWHACRVQDPQRSPTMANVQEATEKEGEEIGFLRDRLMECAPKARPQLPPPDENTVKRILREVRKEHAPATVSEAYLVVKYLIIDHSFMSWGGVIDALRNGWGKR